VSVARRTGIGLVIGGLLAGTGPGLAGAAVTAGQESQAKKALVSISDLPEGWTASAVPSTSAGTFTGAPQLAKCMGVPTKLIANNPPRVVSPLFRGQGGSELVQDTISIYPSTAYAKAVFAAISSRKAAGCISSLMNGATAGAGAAGHVTVTRVASAKGSTAFTLEATVSGTGSTPTPTSTEVVYFFNGPFGNGLDVETSGSQPPAALTQHLLAVVRGRL
jgi:hypothetical protein